MQALKEWQEKRPKLFKKKVYNLTGLDKVALTVMIFSTAIFVTKIPITLKNMN